jgi:hypothetical protein
VLELCADDGCDEMLAQHRFGRQVSRVGQGWRITSDWTVPARTAAGPG